MSAVSEVPGLPNSFTIDQAPIMVVVKLVPGIRSTSGVDELWVSSAYPRFPRELRSMIKHGKLHKVDIG
jgi:hypothetical protein